ncbi:DNA polymerase beta superfamily protein [Castellaniella sp.]|uniref:DNA polymerase beta superfamily protein n=1 Tax=Castellaniella sp. TaxID=1955812 RepID=UPI003C7475EC
MPTSVPTSSTAFAKPKPNTACTCFSRWNPAAGRGGFSSPNSDYDARFIYVHPRDWYRPILD